MLPRMRDEGLIEAVASPRGEDSRRRTYAISDFGREVLAAECRRLEALVQLARDARVMRRMKAPEGVER